MKLNTQQKQEFIKDLQQAHKELEKQLSSWTGKLFITTTQHDFSEGFDFRNLAKELYYMKVLQIAEVELFRLRELQNLLDDIDF